ncbi:sentrin-specific protease 6-like [Notothenia coriiceps]|uniref:Sentrin-specific protease 6-like n=1 Tax=Notothenia coriiceps TaxID=8208 RepID=A0A6I9P0Q2_9TELE|nr:PREDICTED: sentrin-specific protease 6-like [Notothenia coriiceps]
MQTSQGSPVTDVTPLSPVAMATRTRMSTRQHSSYFDDEEEEMTDLQHTFSGPIIKLMVYPPPPAKGGISVTNEDLHCLNEGEFLNDVILDFYLKYLVLERLKKEDAQRIHVFSSFFYKRLNQRERRNAPETSNLPIHKRKHNRVKTWTRHVDLFQKDFIFVPINESAHWYLAVICFPGLNGPLFDQNPQNTAPSSALQSEESVPDSVSPDRPEPPSEPLSVPQASREGATEGDPATPPTEPQYTSELHRISVSYASAKVDYDPFSFSDDQSSCQVLPLLHSFSPSLLLSFTPSLLLSYPSSVGCGNITFTDTQYEPLRLMLSLSSTPNSQHNWRGHKNSSNTIVKFRLTTRPSSRQITDGHETLTERKVETHILLQDNQLHLTSAKPRS